MPVTAILQTLPAYYAHVREQKNPPYQSKAELGAGASSYIVKFTNKLIEWDWSLITKKAMTGNARHGE